jgi:hypothetical protein
LHDYLFFGLRPRFRGCSLVVVKGEEEVELVKERPFTGASKFIEEALVYKLLISPSEAKNVPLWLKDWLLVEPV